MHARDLRQADSGSSDPYVTVIIPNYPERIEKSTATITKTTSPIWNETILQKFLIPMDRLEPLKIIIKDSDFCATDDVLGFCDLDLRDCLSKAGEWGINNIFEVQATPEMLKTSKHKVLNLGYIYIQVKYLEIGMIDDNSDPPLVENLAEMIASQQGLYKGTLKVFLVHAENLAQDGDDVPDPLVIFKVPGGKKVESKRLDNTKNPVWKTIYSIPIQMPLNQIQPMRLEIFDHNTLSNVLLGYLNVQLTDVFKTPGKWSLNQIFQIEGDSKMRSAFKVDSFGEIYIQIMYVPEGIASDEKPFPLTKDIDEQIRK